MAKKEVAQLSGEDLLIFRTQSILHEKATRTLARRTRYVLEGKDELAERANQVYEGRVRQLATTMDALSSIRQAYVDAGIQRTTREDLVQIAQGLVKPTQEAVIPVPEVAIPVPIDRTEPTHVVVVGAEKVNGAHSDELPVPAISEVDEPILDPLDKFRALITEEPNWTIASRAETPKLPSGRYQFGIRPARMFIAAVAYNANLHRVHPKIVDAIRDGYADVISSEEGQSEKSKHGPAKRNIEDFFDNYLGRKGAKLRQLPQEIQDSIARVKKDAILGKMRPADLRKYAMYEVSLPGALGVGGFVVPNPDLQVTDPELPSKKVTGEKKEKTPTARTVEISPYQTDVILSFVQVITNRGWQDNMRRAVTLQLHGSDIPSAATVPDTDREAEISKRITTVARERTRVETKMGTIIESGGKEGESFKQLTERAEKMTGVEGITLAEVKDLISKQATLAELKQKRLGVAQPHTRADKETQLVPAAPKPPEVGEHSNIELKDLEESELLSILALLEVYKPEDEVKGLVGLRYSTEEEAYMSIHQDQIMALPENERVVALKTGLSRFVAHAVSGFDKLEKGRAAKRRGAPIPDYLSGTLNTIDSIRVSGVQVFPDSRNIDTVRRVALRQVPMDRFLPDSRVGVQKRERKDRLEEHSEQADSVRRWGAIIP